MCSNCNTNGFQHGWPGSPGIMVSTPLVSCGCNNFPAQPCSPSFPCGPTGCPIQLDSDCVIYHKNGNIASGLINLGLNNGSTAQLIFDTIDSKLGVLNVNAWSLPYLRAVPYTITNLQQFGQSVDTEFGLVNTAILALQAGAGSPLSKTDTNSIHFILSGTLNHNISANVQISATANNQLSVLADGLYAAPQTLAIDYPNKKLSISSGNTVDFSSLVCGASGFLGNVTADPTAIDGQYWFRTDLAAASGLKIKLNGAVRTITTS